MEPLVRRCWTIAITGDTTATQVAGLFAKAADELRRFGSATVHDVTFAAHPQRQRAESTLTFYLD